MSYRFLGGAILLLAVLLLPRVLDLGQFLTADERRWDSNVSMFTKNLGLLHWADLLEQPHPGITQQWLGAITTHSDSWAVRKLPLATAQSILILIIGYIFYRLWGKEPALLLTVLLAVNPFLVAHTRVYAMDSLLALFCLLALGAFLLWQKNNEWRYLATAGAAASLAVLSKLPGILLIPFISFFLISKRNRLTSSSIFLAAFIVTSCIVLPSLLLNTVPVLQNIFSFFSSADYETMHQASRWYYVSTLFFYSTPLHLLALIALPFAWIYGSKTTAITRQQAFVLLCFAVLFIVMMTLGAKKGDRYILPAFLIMDALVVIASTWLIPVLKPHLRTAIFIIIFAGLLWQLADITRLHPYALAYVNPITQPLFGERRSGWGEGLDLAAEYLNKKPNAQHLKVAAYYPNEFAYRFQGETIELHQYNDGNVAYAVLYRAMFDRGGEAWETDILNNFKNSKPEKVIMLNGLEYAWIYPLSPNSHTTTEN